MKYMGSKRHMLSNGLGDLVLEKLKHAERFVDLFSGSASVSWFAAQKAPVPVLSVDLQTYSSVLALAVTGRTKPLDPAELERTWLEPALQTLEQAPLYDRALALREKPVDPQHILEARELCQEPGSMGPVWGAYGGYYYSPYQALVFDCLLQNLPAAQPERNVALSAVLFAASRCAAAPGHTAQPLRPTERGLIGIRQAWGRDPVSSVKRALQEIAPKHAQRCGVAVVGDATTEAVSLKPGDLAFVDPPYSSVHYSRFYHVLETISRGEIVEVTGAGRYPPPEYRPRSDYSVCTLADSTMQTLLRNLSQSGASVIVTFPKEKASNRLSGDRIAEIADQWFTIERRFVVEKHFSTLGGTPVGSRAARVRTGELVLYLEPR